MNTTAALLCCFSATSLSLFLTPRSIVRAHVAKHILGNQLDEGGGLGDGDVALPDFSKQPIILRRIDVVAIFCVKVERVNTHEERGAYLFAEPIAEAGTELIPNIDAARSALESEKTILVSINLSSQRRHIERRLDRILKRHLAPDAGRKVRSPSKSQARYHLGKPVVATALKKSFDLLDEKLKAEANAEVVDNFELARRARVKVTEREKADEINTEANYRRTVSATVSRYIKGARLMIDNVVEGRFP